MHSLLGVMATPFYCAGPVRYQILTLVQDDPTLFSFPFPSYWYYYVKPLYIARCQQRVTLVTVDMILLKLAPYNGLSA